MIYIFCITKDEDDKLIVPIVEKSYFEEYGCLSDEYPNDDFFEQLPYGFRECCEGIYESEHNEHFTRTNLLAAGFIESTELLQFIESLGE